MQSPVLNWQVPCSRLRAERDRGRTPEELLIDGFLNCWYSHAGVPCKSEP